MANKGYHTTQVNAVIKRYKNKNKTADNSHNRFFSCQYPYLPFINRTEGLYGRLLTEFVKYRPNAVRSVLTTEVKIPPYRPTKLG